MKYDITGGSREQRKWAKRVVEWFSKNKLHYKTNQAVYVNVVIKEVDSAYGYCEWDDDNVRPREFEIEIEQSLPLSEFIATIIHELVHVRQFATSRLKERFKGGYKLLWENQVIDPKKPRLDAPHEVEARDLEFKYFKEFVNTLRYTGETI